MEIHPASHFSPKKNWQKIKDFVGLPVRFIFSHELVSQAGLTTLRDERINICLANAKGEILDIGCGEGNVLIRRWGRGVGIDVYPWEGVDQVCDTRNLPFPNGRFDTVTMVASINHIIEREKVLSEAFRVLKPGGRILLTIPSAIVSFFRHKTAWWDRDQTERGMEEGEVWGFSEPEIRQMLTNVGFHYVGKRRFALNLNCLYMGVKPDGPG